MLNFDVKPDASLTLRLNAVLLPHHLAPAYIIQKITNWRSGYPTSALHQLEIVRHLERHSAALILNEYRDAYEHTFRSIRAETWLAAEYAILRRVCSLFTPDALELINDDERNDMMQVIGEALATLVEYSEADIPLPFVLELATQPHHAMPAPPPRPEYDIVSTMVH